MNYNLHVKGVQKFQCMTHHMYLSGVVWYFRLLFVIVVFSASTEALATLTRLSSWLNWPSVHSVSVPAMMLALVRTQMCFISQRQKHHLRLLKVILFICKLDIAFDLIVGWPYKWPLVCFVLNSEKCTKWYMAWQSKTLLQFLIRTEGLETAGIIFSGH